MDSTEKYEEVTIETKIVVSVTLPRYEKRIELCKSEHSKAKVFDDDFINPPEPCHYDSSQLDHAIQIQSIRIPLSLLSP